MIACCFYQFYLKTNLPLHQEVLLICYIQYIGLAVYQHPIDAKALLDLYLYFQVQNLSCGDWVCLILLLNLSKKLHCQLQLGALKLAKQDEHASDITYHQKLSWQLVL